MSVSEGQRQLTGAGEKKKHTKNQSQSIRVTGEFKYAICIRLYFLN